MEAVARRQDAEPAGAAAGELDRRLDRLGAAVGEHDVTEPGRRHREQSLRQLACAGEIEVITRLGTRLPPRRVSSACQIAAGSWPNGTAPNWAMKSA